MPTSQHGVQSAQAYLKKVSVSSMQPPKSLYVCDPRDKVRDVVQRLVRYQTLALPVVRENDRHDRCLGFIDMMDIVHHIVEMCREKQLVGQWFAAIENDARFESVRVSDVMGESGRNPFHPVALDATLLDVARLMGKHNIHRVPVLDGERIVNVITQSDVVAVLDRARTTELAELGGLQVQEVDVGSTDVVTVDIHAKALEAFKMMMAMRVSAVGVTGEGGELVAVCSARDVRELAYSKHAPGQQGKLMFEDIYLSTGELLRKLRKRELSVNMRAPIVACNDHENFSHIIGRLAASRIHRIFVVDKDNRPVRVIALGDVLRLITS